MALRSDDRRSNGAKRTRVEPTASAREIFSAPGIRDAHTPAAMDHCTLTIERIAPTPRASSPKRSTGCSRRTDAVAVTASIASTSCDTDPFASVSRLVAPFGLLNPQFKPAASGVQWARSPAGPFVCLHAIEP